MSDPLLIALYADPVMAFRYLLPHWFPRKMPWFHRGILAILKRRTDFLLNFGVEEWRDETAEWTEEELIKIERWFKWQRPDGMLEPIFFIERDSDGSPLAVHMKIGRFTELMIPRGFSKTTLLNAANLTSIWFHDTNFILYVSEAGPHAEKQLGNIKRELETNERGHALFGNLVPDRMATQRWREDEIETTSGVVVMARGRGGQVRGLNHNGMRPEDVTVDDVEDTESVSTPEQRLKVKEWFMGDLRPVLPKIGGNGRMTVLGTLLHRESLLMRLAKDPEFTFIRFGARLPDGSMLWPDNMDELAFEAERQSFAIAGSTSKFYMEFQSELRDEETAKFREEFFSGIIQPLSRSDLVACAIAIDPAISEKKTADKTAIAVVGMTAKGKVHVCEIWAKQGADPREQVDKFFELATLWNTNLYGVEAIAYQSALIHLLREEMFRKKRYFEIVPLRHGSTRKTERIAGILQPRYSSKYVSHQREFPIYVGQLLDWPNGGFDESDAVAMGVSLLDPYAAAAADPDKDLGEDEYQPLNEVFGGHFGNAP